MGTMPNPTPQREAIVDIDVSDEMRTSFLEYAYSVIYARALPDARDGLKPVQRRIVYQMSVMGLRPERGHVKSQRVVGDVMAKLHPHGDSAIYDALVRLAQPFAMRLPLVDGHGNFGSLDDGPAAARYTEARMAPAALDLVAGLDEDVVDFQPNYDNQTTQPEVLPAAFPNLLVNGASGIAVGMATNIPPHNLAETVGAATYLLDHPEASVADLMAYLPGPDLPGGGIIVDRTGIREAYETGRGIFRTRAKATIERVSPRKMGIVVTELPYMVGPERVIEKIKEAVTKGRVKGLSAVTNLSDRTNDLRLVIEVKNGFNPEAVLSQLYKHTPLEDSFGINAVALVDGQPRQMSIKQMLEVFLDHRLSVVLRRSHFRLARALERLHLVEGLLCAVLDIDRVIEIIRGSDDVATARAGLMDAFGLDEVQADHILELRLRRLTRFQTIELQAERDELAERIETLRHLVSSEPARRDIVRSELHDVASRLGSPRRTLLCDGEQTSASASAHVPLEIADDPCLLILTTDGALARIPGHEALSREGGRQVSDGVAGVLRTSARSEVGVVTADGLVTRLQVVDAPALPRTSTAPSLRGGVDAAHLAHVATDHPVVALIPLDPSSPPAWVWTAQGRVKRIRPEHPANKESWSLITLEDSDAVIAGGVCTDEADLFAVTTQAQLLRTPAEKIRPQGLSAQGMAGIKVADGHRVLTAAALEPHEIADASVTTVAADATALPGTGLTSVKVSPAAAYPVKGRGGLGVRAHRFLRGEDILALARVGVGLPRAQGEAGHPVAMPELDPRRDGSGSPLPAPVVAIG